MSLNKEGNITEIKTTSDKTDSKSEDKLSENAPLKYVFYTVDDPSHYGHILTKDNIKTLEKWGLSQNMELVKFRFNTSFELTELQRFLKDLMNDKTVKANFPPLASLVLPKDKKEISEIKYKVLSTQATNMDIFDVMYEHNLVTQETGYIHGDFDVYVDDITVSDKLRQALLVEESEAYETFKPEIRDEFLFHIFKRITIGGSLNQYENTVDPYLQMTKDFYKDIVSAAKDPESNKIYIRSIPIQIDAVENCSLYKMKGHPQNFFYVIVDPYQRYVHLWYHNWVQFW